jgi:hypothetical protein
VSFFLKKVEPVMEAARLADGCALHRVLGVRSNRLTTKITLHERGLDRAHQNETKL